MHQEGGLGFLGGGGAGTGEQEGEGKAHTLVLREHAEV